MIGGQLFKNVGFRRFLVTAVVVCIAVAAVYSLSIGDQSDQGDEIEETMDYRTLYDHDGLGLNMQWSIDVPIDGGIDTDVPDPPPMFPVYGYSPLDMADVDSIETYLEGHNLTIDDHTFETPIIPMYAVPPVKFYNDTESICVYAHGDIYVEYNLSGLPSESSKINETRAFEIAEAYLRDHSGIPDDVYKIKVGSSNTSYHFRYIQEIGDYPIYHSAGQNQILIKVDRDKAAVYNYQHHWPSLSEIGEIPAEDIGDPDALVESFIAQHNNRISTDGSARILSVEYYYSATIGYLPTDCAQNSPFYVYLPYMKIHWETGTTFISPLSPVGT